jgi:hypothetical protein
MVASWYAAYYLADHEFKQKGACSIFNLAFGEQTCHFFGSYYGGAPQNTSDCATVDRGLFSVEKQDVFLNVKV